MDKVTQNLKTKRQQATLGFAATWAGQTIFSIGSLPIIGYGLDRLLRQINLVFKFPFYNLHHHGVRHSIKYPSCAKPCPLAASLMRVQLIISFLFLTNMLQAQCVDKGFIDQQIKAKFPEANVDSVRVYIFDGKYFTSYDTLALTNCLNNYSQNQITFLYFSKVKSCGYQPGHGTIYIGTGEFNRLFREKINKRLSEQQKKKNKSQKKTSR